MIDLGSIAGLHERGHHLHAYCSCCDRWRELDLDAMIGQGLGSRRLPIVVRCQQCGERGTLQVRPPSPTRACGGWMDPPTAAMLRKDALAVPKAAL